MGQVGTDHVLVLTMFRFRPYSIQEQAVLLRSNWQYFGSVSSEMSPSLSCPVSLTAGQRELALLAASHPHQGLLVSMHKECLRLDEPSLPFGA